LPHSNEILQLLLQILMPSGKLSRAHVDKQRTIARLSKALNRIKLLSVGLIAGLGGLAWAIFDRGFPGTNNRPIVCTPDEVLHVPPSSNILLNANTPATELLPSNFQRSGISVLIEKSKHRLTMYYNQKPVKAYPVVFGDPRGDKQREGDRKTPEGIFKIQDMYPHPSWSKFLWLNYPTAQSWCKHRRSKQQREIPFSSGIGGEIGIHGVPPGQDSLIKNRTNWTLGCPALTNQDINELYDLVQVGTSVEIIP